MLRVERMKGVIHAGRRVMEWGGERGGEEVGCDVMGWDGMGWEDVAGIVSVGGRVERSVC